jgi:hypothetical protein
MMYWCEVPSLESAGSRVSGSVPERLRVPPRRAGVVFGGAVGDGVTIVGAGAPDGAGVPVGAGLAGGVTGCPGWQPTSRAIISNAHSSRYILLITRIITQAGDGGKTNLLWYTNYIITGQRQ